jgi:putative CocE/NonD family hydrolase
MDRNGLVRWLIGKTAGLPPRLAGGLAAERDIAVPMADGCDLLADRYWPHDMPGAPVVLMRSPYGRGSMFGMLAALLAERGFQVVVQSVRGTAGSGGIFDPMRQEKADGADTVRWVRAQPWFAGKLFTFGGSYLGNVQWAIAAAVPELIDGMAMSMTLSNFRDEILGFGGFTQGGTLAWSQTLQMLTRPAGTRRPSRRSMPKLDRAHGHLPVGAVDREALGKTVSWWQDWTGHDDPDDPWWRAIDHSAAVSRLDAPVSMVAGWQDIFLPFQLKDFASRQAAGQPAWLTIGPWTHAAPGGMIAGLKSAIVLFNDLREGAAGLPDHAPVRLFLQQADEWREYPSWPPPDAEARSLYLDSGHRLTWRPPTRDDVLADFTYDPADPTPAVHGPQVMGGSRGRDMAKLETRADTVSFTSPPLAADLDVIGPVDVDLAIRSDRENTDFFVCLCDVDGRGRARQVSDGYLRLRSGRPAGDATGVRHINLECWPTAYRFRKGNRIRLIVAGGAHPRFARNLGLGEPLQSATSLAKAHQEILQTATASSQVRIMVTQAVR